MRLLIVSHVTHYLGPDEHYYAYGPYAREIEAWAELFPEVVIAAPLRNVTPPQGSYRISSPNVRVAPQREVGGTSWLDKLLILRSLPALVLSLSREMRNADAIHVRCPGNLGLLGALLAPLFSERLVAKYAGQWNGFPEEEWTVRLQRAILRSRWWGHPVLIYGSSPRQPQHVVSFFTSMLSSEQLSRARASAAARQRSPVLRVIYSGRLTKSKNVDVLLRAIAALKSEGIPLKGLVIGGGPEGDSLRALAAELGIADQIEFTGAVSLEKVLDFLERSDVLVLASNTEGWAKAITEAMAFGLVCIGSDRGMIPTFLGDGRGLTVPPRDVGALADALRKVASAPQEFETMRTLAAEWAQQHSLDNMREAIRDLLLRRWNLPGRTFTRADKAASIQ